MYKQLRLCTNLYIRSNHVLILCNKDLYSVKEVLYKKE